MTHAAVFPVRGTVPNRADAARRSSSTATAR